MSEQRPFKCRCLGCQYDEYSVCVRCDNDVYDWPPHEDGWLWPLWERCSAPFRWAWWLVAGRKCEVCQRRFWRGKLWCCSEDCWDKWVPF